MIELSRKKKRKKQSKGRTFIVMAVIFFCVCINVKGRDMKKQSMELVERQQELENQIEQENQRAKELEDLQKYMKTKKFVEQIAKEKLGLVYPDEIVIQPAD